ncbi:hypothetical protein [Candidatus Entotheonella palauensis]|uniref:hypothetical protein n=1 Tax=Candidatus Entotheonella palauensis TaxID=93172 RepID=UPI000B7FAE42|nr:hypothetical protein [Candidatus Entotheonella palauensis]
MEIISIIRWIHILTMVVVLGGYLFLCVFWWPVIRRATDDVRVQVRLVALTLRRFFTSVVLALTVEILTGGLYLIPHAYRSFGSGEEMALAAFHQLLIWKLAAVFLVIFLVLAQLFGMAFRITRMDAGILDFDPALFSRIMQRIIMVSYVIIALLTFTVIVSTAMLGAFR